MNSIKWRLQREWRHLQQYEWQTLTLAEAGEWPGLFKALIGVGLFSLALMISYLGWTADVRLALAAAQRQEVRLLGEFRRRATNAAGLADLNRELQMLDHQVAQARGWLESTQATPALMERIGEVALRHELTLESIQLQPVRQHAFYNEHSLALQVTGDFHQLASFVADIGRLETPVTQHDFTLAPLEPGSHRLRLALVARHYRELAP